MASDAVPVALTIAGSDCSGGAGIQADLKTFAAFGVYGASVLTALTAQNTKGVDAIHEVPADFITAQLNSVFSDIAVGAVKTGMLATEDIIAAVVRDLETWGPRYLVVDPVMVATSGDVLLEPAAQEALKTLLIPRADLITPNLPEAAHLLGTARAASLDEMQEQAEALRELGPRAVLLKGGHGLGPAATDVYYDGREFEHLSRPWIETSNTHGTGCTLSAAITAGLSLGESMGEAIAAAKTFTHAAIVRAAQRSVGGGRGPVIHNPSP